MPRKRNYDTIARVLDASWDLFGEKGYTDTSYADLARVSGVNRATVQHYFPKKELIASMNMELFRSACAELVNERYPEAKEPIARQYLVGQIYVAGLLSTKQTRRFAHDVLESRAFTDATIATDLDWSVSEVLGQNTSANVELRQDVIAAMGGLYGLMYHTTLTGEGFNLSERIRPGLRSLGALAGYTHEECDRIFDRYVLTRNELDSLVDAAIERARELVFEHPFE